MTASALPQMNVQNLTATIVHYLTFGSFPASDTLGRPLFAYGQFIHDQCERRAHYEAGRFVLAWGDEAHRQGYCLYKMGCKARRPTPTARPPVSTMGRAGRSRSDTAAWLHDAAVLGPDESVLPATADHARRGERRDRRPGRLGGRGHRGRTLGRARRSELRPHEAEGQWAH